MESSLQLIRQAEFECKFWEKVKNEAQGKTILKNHFKTSSVLDSSPLRGRVRSRLEIQPGGTLGGEVRFPWSQCSVADERDLHCLGGLKAIIGQLMLCYHADFSIDFWLNSTCWSPPEHQTQPYGAIHCTTRVLVVPSLSLLLFRRIIYNDATLLFPPPFFFVSSLRFSWNSDWFFFVGLMGSVRNFLLILLCWHLFLIWPLKILWCHSRQ